LLAKAFEALASVHLAGGRLQEGADAWEEALRAHERLEGPDSEICVDMRASLEALHMAVAGAAHHAVMSGQPCHPDESGSKSYTRCSDLDSMEQVDRLPDAWD